jgi:HK97 family phage major capsid protein
MSTKITKEKFKEMCGDLIKDQITEAITAAREDDKVALESLVEEKYAAYSEELDKTWDEKVKAIAGDETHLKDEGKDPKGGFVNFADFAHSTFKAGRSGTDWDEKLVAYDAMLKAAGTPSMTEGDGASGGFLVPEEFRNELLKVAVENSNILQSAMIIPMATNSVKIPTVSGFDRSGGTVHGGVQFKWLNEEAQKTGTKPKLGNVELNLKKVAGLTYVSDELMEDSPISIQPLITSMFSDALTYELDWVLLNGTGAGQPLGIINAPCLISVAAEGGQGADTILFENIVKMFARLSNKRKGVWYANDDTFKQLATMSLAVGTGGSIAYMPAGGLSGKPFDTLMGKPIVYTEHCRTLGDLGDIYFTDFSQYLVGQKSGNGAGMQFASSMHLKFDYDQTAFRFVFRIDGQPWWKSALTTRYATDTLSPFVGLAAR